jgi:hypothetical protein
MGRGQLQSGLRGPASHRRSPGRPVRTPPPLHGWRRDLHCRVSAVRALVQCRDLDRREGVCRPRRRVSAAGIVVDHSRGLARRCSPPRLRSYQTRTTPAVALGVTEHVWSIGELIDAALKAVPVKPAPTAPDRRRQFRVIQGGKL